MKRLLVCFLPEDSELKILFVAESEDEVANFVKYNTKYDLQKLIVIPFSSILNFQ